MKTNPLKLFSFLCFILLLSILVPAQSAQAASAPSYQAKVTSSNILKLLNVYDPDGAFILETMKAKGDNLTSWWKSGEKIVSSIGTAVHEELHHFSLKTAANPSRQEMIYVGNKKSISVPFTQVYASQNMAAGIAKKLRTFRYETYVGADSTDLASNTWGAYGLLNEFTSYYWGLHTNYRMFDYYKSMSASPEVWSHYISSVDSEICAYAEFKFYLLRYLIYAKKHHPDVYKGIINNKNFLTAYQTIDRKYFDLIQDYDTKLTQAASILTKGGYPSQYTGIRFTISSRQSASITRSDYNILMKEMTKSPYLSMMKVLGDRLSVDRSYITDITAKAKGLKLTWRKSPEATSYSLYRKASGERSYKLVKSTSKTTWTDTSVKAGIRYTYKVTAAYKSSSGSITRSKASVTRTGIWLAAPTISSARITSSTQMTVKWKQVKKATGYQVEYSLFSNFYQSKTAKTYRNTMVSTRLGVLKPYTTHYIRIRAFKVSNGQTYYSPWSKSIKSKVG